MESADLSLSVLLKLSPEEAAALDRVRGETLRATWVKQLVRGAVAARERQGGPTGLYVLNDQEIAERPARLAAVTSIHPPASGTFGKGVPDR